VKCTMGHKITHITKEGGGGGDGLIKKGLVALCTGVKSFHGKCMYAGLILSEKRRQGKLSKFLTR